MCSVNNRCGRKLIVNICYSSVDYLTKTLSQLKAPKPLGAPPRWKWVPTLGRESQLALNLSPRPYHSRLIVRVRRCLLVLARPHPWRQSPPVRSVAAAMHLHPAHVYQMSILRRRRQRKMHLPHTPWIPVTHLDVPREEYFLLSWTIHKIWSCQSTIIDSPINSLMHSLVIDINFHS